MAARARGRLLRGQWYHGKVTDPDTVLIVVVVASAAFDHSFGFLRTAFQGGVCHTQEVTCLSSSLRQRTRLYTNLRVSPGGFLF